MKVLLTAALIIATALPASAQIDEASGGRLAFMAQARVEREHRRELREKRRAARVPDVPTSSTGAVITSTPTYSGGWGDELAAVGFPTWAIPHMLEIIDRESGGNPLAINPTSGACGLAQIWPAQSGCLDAMTNLRMAYAKFQASGFAPWGG